MGTRASVIIKTQEKQTINLFQRSDGYLTNGHNIGFGVDIMNCVDQLLRLKHEKLLKNTNIDTCALSQLLIANSLHKRLKSIEKYNIKYFHGATLSIQENFDINDNHDFIYTITPNNIHIYEYEGGNNNPKGCLFNGGYKAYKKFLKSYKVDNNSYLDVY